MHPCGRRSPGRTVADSRLYFEAVLWRVGAGSRRRDLPEKFGNLKSVFKRIFKALSGSFDLASTGADSTVV